MKKQMQFLFLITALMLICAYSYAGINSLPEIPSKTEVNAKGGSLPILIIVEDAFNNPIAGAEVNAPCTGLSPQYTDAKGTTTFTITGSCKCSGGAVQVTVPDGDLTEAPIGCGGPYYITAKQ